jgi:hypothetical protein
MRALALTDDQLSQLRSTAALLPVELRADLVRLVAGYMQLEGDLASAAAFNRALTFAVDHLYRDVA